MKPADRASKILGDLQFSSYVAGLEAAIGTLQAHLKEVRKTKILPEGEGDLMEILMPSRTNGSPKQNLKFSEEMDKVLSNAKNWLTAREIAELMGIMDRPNPVSQVQSTFNRQYKQMKWVREKDKEDGRFIYAKRK